MRTAVFPGSFDPFTNGHFEIVNRGLRIFDKIIIAIGENNSKQPCFDLDVRMQQINSAFGLNERVIIKKFSGLTVDFCKAEKAGFILRGVRNGIDCEYEKSISAMNARMAPDIETVILFSSADTAMISSTILREIYKNKGDISPFIPYTL